VDLQTTLNLRGDTMTNLIEGKIRVVLNPTAEQWGDWRWHFRNRITTADQLGKFVNLTDREKSEIDHVGQVYPFAVTPYYLSLARSEDLSGPILRQSIPSIDECSFAAYGEDDPLGELDQSPVPGLVHRYPDRALLLVSTVCSVFCRHCTRKRQTKLCQTARVAFSEADIDRAIDYIRRTTALRDVIISGGDPLTLSNARLAAILAKIRTIPHVEIIRIGTRYPAVLPQRIDEEFCRICDQYGPIWLNTQFNHPDEVTPDAARAVRELLRAGVPVNNQTVLLRGINDSVETLTSLNHALLKIRVRPYYLYQADDVRGTAHFRTTIETGVKIIEGMQGYTSGLAIPFFVVDSPDGCGKIPVGPDYVVSRSESEWILRNYQGSVVHYGNPDFSSLVRETLCLGL
jgi:lysine 2,3-aminomutase